MVRQIKIIAQVFWATMLLMWSTVPGCGVDVGNPKNPDPTKKTTPTVVADNETVTEASTGILDDSLEAVADSAFNSSEAATGLVGARTAHQPLGFIAVGSVCSITADNATQVALTVSGPLNLNVTRAGVALSMTGSSENTTTSLLKVPQGTIPCNRLGTRALVHFSQQSSLTMNVTLHKKVLRQLKVSSSGDILRSFTSTIDGTREETMTKSSTATSGFVVGQNLIYSHTTSTTFVRKNGVAVSYFATNATKEGAPLVVTATYDATGSLQQKIIVSGTIVSTINSAQKMEMTYNNLALASSADCMPSTGTISGALYDTLTSVTPSRTYVIDFARWATAGATSIDFSDGSSQKIQPDFCSLLGQ